MTAEENRRKDCWVLSGCSLGTTVEWLGQPAPGWVIAKVQLVSAGYSNFNLMVLIVELMAFSLEVPTKSSQMGLL